MGYLKSFYSKFKKWEEQKRLTKEELLKIEEYNAEVDIIKHLASTIAVEIMIGPQRDCEWIMVDDEFLEAWEIHNEKHNYIYLLYNSDLYFVSDPSHHSKCDHSIELKHIDRLSNPKPAIDPTKITAIHEDIDYHAREDFGILTQKSNLLNRLELNKLLKCFSKFNNV